MEVLVNKVSPHEWEDGITGYPGHTFYHHYVWKQVIEESFGHHAFYIAVKDNGKFVGFLPLIYMESLLFGEFLISMPFFNYGGIWAMNREVEKLLWNEAVKLASTLEVDYLELRQKNPLGLDLPYKSHKVTFILPLSTTVEGMWKGVGPKVRNQIRKAERGGCCILIGGGELLSSFYRVFAYNMRDLGTPVYSRRFFENICGLLKENVRIFVVKLGEKDVASGFIMFHHNTVEIPWASSIRKYNKLCVNMYLYWKVIEYSIQNGFQYFDFGRCTRNSGTYKFKKQWGGEEYQLWWYYWTSTGEPKDVSPANPKYRLFINIWKRLPLFVTNTIGPYIVKNIP